MYEKSMNFKVLLTTSPKVWLEHPYSICQNPMPIVFSDGFLSWTWTLALQCKFWISQYLSMLGLRDSSHAIFPPFANGTPFYYTRLLMHIMNVILNTQWNQPLGCKWLSFDPLSATAFVQGRGERQPRVCKKKNTMNGW